MEEERGEEKEMEGVGRRMRKKEEEKEGRKKDGVGRKEEEEEKANYNQSS